MNGIMVRWLPVLAWMVVILSASGDRLSFQHTSRIIGPLVRWLFPHATDDAIHGVVVFVRKSAHVGEYAVLALLVWHARRKALGLKSQSWRWSNEARTIFLVMLYAATDEFHQLFVPSRQASVWDVLLDTSGAVFALLLVWGLGRWRKWW